jgi:O-antigen/teichoic acid export membrane protein
VSAGYDERALRGVAASAMAWQSASMVVTQVLLALVSLGVAAFTAPGEYGLWGIAAIVFNARVFATLGFGQALIYFRTSDRYRDYVDTAFVATAAAACIVGAAVFAMSPVLADALNGGFDHDDVTLALRLTAITLVFSAIGDVPLGVIEKSLDFRRRAIPEVTTSAAYALLAAGLLAIGLGVWSIIVARAAYATVRTVALWVGAPTRPRWPPHFRRDVFLQVLPYSMLLNATGIVAFTVYNLDTFAVAYYAGAAAVGAYALAYTITSLVPTFIQLTLARVSFSVYAAIRDSAAALRSAAQGAYHLTVVIILPVTVALLTLAPDLLVQALGEEWRSAGPLLTILAVFGLFRALAVPASAYLNATGRAAQPLTGQLLALGVAVALLVPLHKHGAEGIAWCFTAGQAALALYVNVRARAIALRPLLASVVPSVLASGAACAAAVAVKKTGGTAAAWLAMVAFIAVYAGALIAGDGRVRRDVSALLRPANAHGA